MTIIIGRQQQHKPDSHSISISFEYEELIKADYKLRLNEVSKVPPVMLQPEDFLEIELQKRVSDS